MTKPPLAGAGRACYFRRQKMRDESSKTGRKRGRPPIGATPVNVRMPPGELAALDSWIKAQPHGLSRPQALRRLALAALDDAAATLTKSTGRRRTLLRQRDFACGQE